MFGLAPHDRAQRTGLGVVHEQRLGHLRLYAEHVDQEAERAEVAGESLEGRADIGLLCIDFCSDQRVDVVAHAQDCGRRAGPYRALTTHRASRPTDWAPESAHRDPSGRGNIDRCASRIRTGRAAIPARRFPSSDGRRPFGRVPPSSLRAARPCRRRAPRRCAKPGTGRGAPSADDRNRRLRGRLPGTARSSPPPSRAAPPAPRVAARCGRRLVSVRQPALPPTDTAASMSR